MCSDMACVPALSHGPVRIGFIISIFKKQVSDYDFPMETPSQFLLQLTNLMRAVVLIIRLAHFTLQTRPDLSANADPVSHLDSGDFVADFDGLADYLVAHAKGQVGLSPAAGNGMDIRSADPAAFDLDVDVPVIEWLGFELARTC